MRRLEKLGQVSVLTVAVAAFSLSPASAQDTTDAPVYSGPLAGPAARLAKKGISFNANVYDFYNANPSFGLETGHQSNSAYWVTGVDLDLERLLGWRGSKIHFKETFFTFVYNNEDIAGQFGDSSLGYQTTYNLRDSMLSQLTFEQSILNGKVNIEFGRTHPRYYFTPQTCQTFNTCYQDVLDFDAGYISPLYSVWGGRIKMALSPSSYFQIGTFSLDDNPWSYTGWEWDREIPNGTLSMAEYGFDTAFGKGNQYTGHYALTGYYNSGDHPNNLLAVNGTSRGLNPGLPPRTENGSSGMVFNSTQIVWREDGGSARIRSPRTLAFYTGAGLSFNSTVPIKSDVYFGFNLNAPIASRPNDKIGVKVRWGRMNDSFAQYLADANFTAGGSGTAFDKNKAILELNADVDLGGGIILEPVVQYVVNPNSYYKPFSAKRPEDGFYVGGTLKVPLGQLAGIEAR